MCDLFDFAGSTFDPSSVPSAGGDQSAKGGIRVSLACIPCRSRHVKCGAEIPVCRRCQLEDKPCFYAKSRRGMRDRNIPRKRASMRQAEGTSPKPTIRAHELIMGSGRSSSPDGSDSPQIKPIPSDEMQKGKRLLDLYYVYFHKAHPFILPKYYFLRRWQSDPESLVHIVAVMQYVGSLYAPDIDSTDPRSLAVQRLHLATLPPNGFTVQALLLAAIASHAEDRFDEARSFLDRAINLALGLGMNARTFANMERDPVMAESWRRTYWLMFVTDCNFSGIRRQPQFSLYSVEVTVELPCEECDFDGIIPNPRTLDEYDKRDFEDEIQVFSSFTYLIDLTRIMGYILGLRALQPKEMEDAVANADAMLVNWKLHLPLEKQGIVDKNEEVDEILFQAHNTMQLLLVFIHRPLSRLYHSPLESISTCAAPQLPHEPVSEDDKMYWRTYWQHTKKALEAAEAAIALYALPCPIIHHTPLGICSISHSTMANISACAWVLKGEDAARTRDRVRLGLGALKILGEVWSASRRVERETKAVARGVFEISKPGLTLIGVPEARSLVVGNEVQGLDLLWQDLGDIDGLQVGPWGDTPIRACH